MVKKIVDNQVARLLDLVPYLTLNQGVALEKIASDFSTSKSAVLDDLNTLWMCGLPGYTPLELIDLSFDTGYVSIRNAETLSVPRKLNDSEIAALIIGLSILRESVSSSTNHIELIDGLTTKLSAKSHVVSPEMISGGVAPDLRDVIHSAVNNGEKIRITYHSFSRDEVNTRVILPLRIFHEGNIEQVHAYCELSEDFRVFRLDRISEAVMQGKKSVIPAVNSAVVSNQELKIRVHSNLRKISETFIQKGQSELRPGDDFVSSAFTTEWAVRTICSLQGTAEVLEPLDIRELVATRAQKALNQYQ